MKKSEKMARRMAITVLVLMLIEIGFFLASIICLLYGHVDYATYLLVLIVVVDQQGGGLQGVNMGAMEREMEIEQAENDLEDVAKKTFSERVEELHKKNNKI